MRERERGEKCSPSQLQSSKHYYYYYYYYSDNRQLLSLTVVIIIIRLRHKAAGRQAESAKLKRRGGKYWGEREAREPGGTGS